MQKRWIAGIALLLAACTGASAPAPKTGESYRWTDLTHAASYRGSYNFPVHVSSDGRFVALHSDGTWSSRDGRTWIKEPLPPSGTNSAYLPIVQHAGATWAIGALTGNYQGFTIDPVVKRTRDYRAWELLGRASGYPHLVFAAAASFDGAIWLLGGYDGTTESNAVWKSRDGLRWDRVIEHAPWSARSGAEAVVFEGRLWLIGGGVLDGALAGDAWSSADGRTWRRETARISDPLPTGFTAQVYDGKLWLVGANRAGGFSSSMLVSEDGQHWRRMEAPWSPRGGTATWVAGGKMYLTGGKFSRQVNGEPQFMYSNDVWMMEH